MDRKYLILLVEDEPDLLTVTAFRLRKAGYDVITATDGLQVLDLVRAHRPDLVLLDLNIPGMDGRTVGRQMKEDANTAGIPLIVFSASSESIKSAMSDIGADDAVIKPYEVSVLKAKIRQFLPAEKGQVP